MSSIAQSATRRATKLLTELPAADAVRSHSLPPLEPHLQPQSDFLGAGIGLRVARQQQTGLQISEPGRHHEIIGGDFELQRARFGEVRQVLLDQFKD